MAKWEGTFGGLDAEFWARKPLIGMVHLPPLPGSPRDTGMLLEAMLAQAVADARALEAGGADAVMVENFFDAPFAKDAVPPHTIAAMTRAVQVVREAISLPTGVNVLRNDARSALAIAHICGAQFIRVNIYVGAAVTDQGIIEGAAREVVLYRRQLRADVAIWADVFVKHAAQLGAFTLEDAAKDAVLRGLADALIVSGAATGSATEVEDVRRVKAAVPAVPVLVGSGFRAETAPTLLAHADGAIVGTSLKRNGQVAEPVDVERVRALRAAMDVFLSGAKTATTKAE
ncbi:MAG TPA: BtpA/SgcQ family protein [Chthonomonadaceae bacterium]|nr:BtpA/SgcQ family protein [Chthonomonadaceae bacterium]